MTLLLGNYLGGRILGGINNSPKLTRTINRFSRTIQRVIPGYVPGKTRDAYRLFQYAAEHPNERYSIDEHGVSGGERRIIENAPLAAEMRLQGITSFHIPLGVTLEEFLSATRCGQNKTFGYLMGCFGMPLTFLGLWNHLVRGGNGYIPSFISEHIGTTDTSYMLYGVPRFMSYALLKISMHFNLKQDDMRASRMLMFRIINHMLLATSIFMVFAAEINGLGDSFIPRLFRGTPDLLDIPIPIFALFSCSWYFKALEQRSLAQILNTD